VISTKGYPRTVGRAKAERCPTYIRATTTLATVPNVASCAIGLETAIVPSDYPLIRIVPTRLNPPNEGSMRRQIEVLIYFGAALLEASDGLEAVYETLLEMEEAILEGVQFALVKAGIDQGAFIASRFVETITDEDRLPHYKLFAMRWRVEG